MSYVSPFENVTDACGGNICDLGVLIIIVSALAIIVYLITTSNFDWRTKK